MGLLDRIADARRGESRSSIDTWLNDFLIPSVESGSFGYAGHTYPFGLNQTLTGQRIYEFTSTLPGYAGALKRCPPAFAAQMVRALVMSQARFTFRNLPSSRTPRRRFGTGALAPLEKPWPNATTGEMIARMEWHAGLTGNAYVMRRPRRLRVLRPDWVAILYGSDLEPEDPSHALDGEIVGYVYANQGFTGTYVPTTILPADIAHWSPIPDPECAGIGMSWITPALRDLQGDIAATEHKLQFFKNGATPNMVVKGIPAIDKTQFDAIVDMLEERHKGIRNAYKTLYLTTGADATVVGSDLSQLDFKNTQGAGETRIAALSRVHPTILGVAEGLAGSSLNAGNFAMARRIWADTWVYPSLQDLAASLAPLVNVPDDAELWFDVADMPILREDAQDAANISLTQAQTVTTLVKEGFTPESAIAATNAQDMTLLVHTGLVSVQLQPPGTAAQPGEATPPDGGAKPAPSGAKPALPAPAPVKAIAAGRPARPNGGRP